MNSWSPKRGIGGGRCNYKGAHGGGANGNTIYILWQLPVTIVPEDILVPTTSTLTKYLLLSPLSQHNSIMEYCPRLERFQSWACMYVCVSFDFTIYTYHRYISTTFFTVVHRYRVLLLYLAYRSLSSVTLWSVIETLHAIILYCTPEVLFTIHERKENETKNRKKNREVHEKKKGHAGRRSMHIAQSLWR